MASCIIDHRWSLTIRFQPVVLDCIDAEHGLCMCQFRRLFGTDLTGTIPTEFGLLMEMKDLYAQSQPLMLACY